MAIRTDIDRGYRMRMLLVGAAALGFSLWCLYDGLVKYPHQIERATKHEKLKEADRLDEWPAYAKEQGWSPLDPGEPKTHYDLGMQYVMSAGTALVGIFFLTTFFRVGGRWIEADATGLSTSWQQRVPFANIAHLDKRRWKKKGIAVVRYESDGKRGRLVLDDCKYEPETTVEVLRAVEAELTDEQIVGGFPEPPPEEEHFDQDYDESAETLADDEPPEDASDETTAEDSHRTS